MGLFSSRDSSKVAASLRSAFPDILFRVVDETNPKSRQKMVAVATLNHNLSPLAASMRKISWEDARMLACEIYEYASKQTSLPVAVSVKDDLGMDYYCDDFYFPIEYGLALAEAGYSGEEHSRRFSEKFPEAAGLQDEVPSSDAASSPDGPVAHAVSELETGTVLVVGIQYWDDGTASVAITPSGDRDESARCDDRIRMVAHLLANLLYSSQDESAPEWLISYAGSVGSELLTTGATMFSGGLSEVPEGMELPSILPDGLAIVPPKDELPKASVHAKLVTANTSATAYGCLMSWDGEIEGLHLVASFPLLLGALLREDQLTRLMMGVGSCLVYMANRYESGKADWTTLEKMSSLPNEIAEAQIVRAHEVLGI